MSVFQNVRNALHHLVLPSPSRVDVAPARADIAVDEVVHAGVMLADAERPLPDAELDAAEKAAIVSRIETKIVALDADANLAAEDGDASAIEAIERSISVEKRLLTVARRACVEATARLEQVQAAVAEARAAVEAEARAARLAELDALLAPETLAAELDPINEALVVALAEVDRLAKMHDAARAAHVERIAERSVLGGDDVPQAVERAVSILNLALAAAADDPARLQAIIRDGREWLPVTNFGIARDASDVSLARALAELGCGWITPKPRGIPSPLRAKALRDIRDFARTATTMRVITEYAVARFDAVGAEENRLAAEALERDPAHQEMLREHEELQRRMAGSGESRPAVAEVDNRMFDQFL